MLVDGNVKREDEKMRLYLGGNMGVDASLSCVISKKLRRGERWHVTSPSR